MSNITKHNYTKFSRKNLLPKADGSRPFTREAEHVFERNEELLQKFKAYYDSLNWLREMRERCKKYYFGDQL